MPGSLGCAVLGELRRRIAGGQHPRGCIRDWQNRQLASERGRGPIYVIFPSLPYHTSRSMRIRFRLPFFVMHVRFKNELLLGSGLSNIKP